MFHTVSNKRMINVRNEIFLKYGLPELEKNGFERSPFSTAWFGRDFINGFCYEFCRLSEPGKLEYILVDISRGDKYIKVTLNIFNLVPNLQSLQELNGLDGMCFSIPPTSLTEMELRSDDYKGIPLFYRLFRPSHRIGCYFTERGFKRKVQKLERLISSDMKNIDRFIKRWHEMHTSNVTDWEGNQIIY